MYYGYEWNQNTKHDKLLMEVVTLDWKARVHVHVKARSHETRQRLRLRQHFFWRNAYRVKNLEITENEKSFSRQEKVGNLKSLLKSHGISGQSGKIVSENKNTLIWNSF